MSLLLQKHCPLYYTDASEKTKMINLNVYVKEGVKNQDSTVTGLVTTQPDGRTLLHYFAFYPRDDGLQLFGCFSVDAHAYDLERVTVELNALQAVTGVCYFPHGEKEHFWIRGHADLEKILVQGRTRVYCSRGKHASYPICGTIWRYLGFANDHINPVFASVNVVEVNQEVLDHPRIDGVFRNIPLCLGEIDSLPTIALSRVRFHLLCTLPPFRFAKQACHL